MFIRRQSRRFPRLRTIYAHESILRKSGMRQTRWLLMLRYTPDHNHNPCKILPNPRCLAADWASVLIYPVVKILNRANPRTGKFSWTKFLPWSIFALSLGNHLPGSKDLIRVPTRFECLGLLHQGVRFNSLVPNIWYPNIYF